MSGLTSARRLVSVLLILSVAAVLFGLFENRGQQTFAAFGAAKRVLLPVSYLLAFLALVLPPRSDDVMIRKRNTLPPWIWTSSLAIALSLLCNFFAALIADEGQLGVSNVLQGLALFFGFTLFAWLGWLSDEWEPSLASKLFAVLLGAAAAVAAVFRSTGLTPLIVLVIPATFLCLAFAIVEKRHRSRFISLLVVMSVLALRSLKPNPTIPISQAVIGQIVGCSGLLLVWLLPRALRLPLSLLGLCAGLAAFVRLAGWSLIVGSYYSTDVTIAQRSYEAAQVLDRLNTSDIAPFVGLGPGGTVNLVNSPDAGTLLSSGRHLAAVDDVHLLPGYLALKLGLLAFVWIVPFVAALTKVYISVMTAPRRDPWAFALLLFVVAGVVDALPAATNLLTNPLIPLLLGVLWARTTRPVRREEHSTATNRTQVGVSVRIEPHQGSGDSP